MTYLYSVGFLFSNDLSKVALIRKIKPAWQKGKLNGVGGHVEDNENFRMCMQREFFEEAGILTVEDSWKLIAELNGPDWTMGVFASKFPEGRELPTFKHSPEQVAWYFTHSISSRADVIPNLHWLIPLCLDESVDHPIKVKCK